MYACFWPKVQCLSDAYHWACCELRTIEKLRFVSALACGNVYGSDETFAVAHYVCRRQYYVAGFCHGKAVFGSLHCIVREEDLDNLVAI